MQYIIPRSAANRLFISVMILLCCTPPPAFAQAEEQSAVRDIAAKYFDAYRRKDLDAVLSLWSRNAPDFAATRTELQKLFADNADTDAHVLEYRRVKVGPEEAVADIVVGAVASNAGTVTPSAAPARIRRTLVLKKEGGAWKVWQSVTSEEYLAAAILGAPTEAEGRALLSESGDLATGELVKALVRAGRNLAGQGRYAQALAAYAPALEVARRLDDKTALISTWRLAGIAHNYLGENGQALDCFRKSLELAEQVKDKTGIRNAANALGIVYGDEGDYTRALEYDQQSLQLSEEFGDKLAVARDLNNIAVIHDDQGNLTLALDYYLRSLKLKEEVGNKPGIAYTLNNIAGVYGTQGKYAQALDSLQKSLALKEELKDGAGTADTLHNIGFIYYLQGDYTKALDYEQRSLKLAEEVASLALVGHIWTNLGEIHLRLGEYAAALEAAEHAASIALKADLRAVYWQARAITGRAHLGLREPELARRDLLDSISTIEKLRGQVAGNEQDQQRFFQDKLAPYYAMVDLSISRGEPAEALKYAEQAKGRVLLDVLSNGRVQIVKAMTRAEIDRDRSLTAEMTLLNNQISRLKLQPKPSETELAELDARMAKARLEYESFQTGLYAAHPELKIQRGQSQPLSLGEAAEMLPDSRTALLEYVLTGEKSYLFVLTKAAASGSTNKPAVKLAVYPLKLTGTELAQAAEDFRQKMAGRDLTIKSDARRLYGLLIRPAEEQLRGVGKLCIVPDGALWGVPFQALHAGERGYLIEQYAVFYAPSLSVLRAMTRKGAATREAHRGHNIIPSVGESPRDSPSAPSLGKLLAVGNPALNDETASQAQSVQRGETLGPLPEAEKEVNTIGRLYGPEGSKILTGREAREREVKLDADKYLVLHFATHAILNDNNPMYSRILLSRDAGNSQEDGLLEAWEITKLNLSAELVVLSACQTARGRFAAGEGIIGMSWSLFIAGCPAAVVSQWKVDSARSAELMIAFHRNLVGRGRRGGGISSKSEALRQAALRMLRGPYNHPSYWAGFILIGDER